MVAIVVVAAAVVKYWIVEELKEMDQVSKNGCRWSELRNGRTESKKAVGRKHPCYRYLRAGYRSY